MESVKKLHPADHRYSMGVYPVDDHGHFGASGGGHQIDAIDRVAARKWQPVSAVRAP